MKKKKPNETSVNRIVKGKKGVKSLINFESCDEASEALIAKGDLDKLFDKSNFTGRLILKQLGLKETDKNLVKVRTKFFANRRFVKNRVEKEISIPIEPEPVVSPVPVLIIEKRTARRRNAIG